MIKSDGSVIISTGLDDEGLNKGIDKLGGNFNKLKSIATKAIGAIGLGTLVKEGVQYNATIEQLQTSFEVMTGSATKASEVVERLKEIGAKTPFEFTGLAETTQLLMNYGFTADDAIDKMMMLGDISQGSAEKMNRIATAYGQMSSAGKVSLEDVKQMIEAGFNPLREISDSTGESMESLYSRISKGTISVDEITASMERSTSVGGKYFQSMDKQSQTLNGQWSTLKDNFNNFIGEVLGPLNVILAEKILPAINNVLGALGEKLETTDWEKFGNTLNTILSIIVPLTAAFIAYKAVISISSIITTVTTALNGMTLAQYALNLAMSLNPIGIVVAAIAALVAAIIYLWNTNEDFRNAIINAWNAICNFFQNLGENIKNFFINGWNSIVSFFTEGIPNFINSVIQWFSDLPYKIGELIGKILGTIVKFGLDAWNWVTTELPKIIQGIIQWFSELPEKIKTWLVKTVNKVIDWGYDMNNKARDAISTLINNIINWFKNLPNNIMNIGKNLVQGLWNGITGAGNWLKNKISSFASGIINGFKSAFGIHSPSKVFNQEIGRFLALGLGEGFDDNINKVFKKMKSTVDFETQKLSANLTSSNISKTQIEDNRQAVLQSIDDNKEITVNTTTKLDSKVVAREVNKVNARQKLQYGLA